MSEYRGRIAIGVIVVIVVSIGFAVELNNFLPANTLTTAASSSSSLTQSTTSSATLTSTLGTGALSGNCPEADNATSDGYNLDLHAPLIAYIGDDVCISTSFTNLSNQSALPPLSEYIVVRNATAAIYFQATCMYSGPSSDFGPNSPSWDCSAPWNTANAYNGLVPTKATYTVWVTLDYSWEATPITTAFFISMRPSTTGNETTTSSASHTSTELVNGSGIPTCTFLNGQTHVLFSPLQQSGPVYLKVVTNQGALVRNGTVFTTHQSSASNSQGSGDYCILLSADSNSTGYMQISDTGAVLDGGVPLGGAYNFTVRAEYGGNSFQVPIPQIVVHSGVITYITVSIPTGEVTEVTVDCSSQSGGCTSSTTTITGSGGG